MLPKGTYYLVDPIDVFKRFRGFLSDSMPDGNDYSKCIGHKYYSIELSKKSSIEFIQGDSFDTESGYFVLVPESLVRMEHPGAFDLSKGFMLEFDEDFECRVKGSKLIIGTNTFRLNIAQEDIKAIQETNEKNAENSYFKLHEENSSYYNKDHYGERVCTHLDNPMNAMSLATATLLVDDLNSIYNSDFLKDLRSSFCYCALSTFQERSGAAEERDYRLEELIQWDGIFRLDPRPQTMILKMHNCRATIDFFGENYVDLELNYCSSLADMEAKGTSMVPDKTIAMLRSVFEQLSSDERFLVDLIGNYSDYVSISAATLLIAKKISIDAFLNTYFVLKYIEDPKKKKFRPYRKFLKTRIKYLMAFKSTLRKDVQ